MRRNFRPSPIAEAMPLLRWLLIFIIIGVIGRWWLLSGVCFIVFLFHALFHRNPRRRIPEDPLILVAPADGKVTDITEVDEPRFIKGKAWRIGIFLSVFDVHTQIAPCDVTLKSSDYQPGKFFDARHPNCSPQNENQSLWLETQDGVHLIVKQIAGFIARRIVLWRLPQEEICKGELLGMIRYGSRVEFFMPVGFAEILVRAGDRVRGGGTPVARRKKALGK